MSKKENLSGAETPFKDKDGNVIHIHDYVKDADGNRYYINSHCQAVPDGSDAPAVELARLSEESQVSVMSIEEVLNMKPQVERRRRGGRRKKVEEEPRPAAGPAPAEPAGESPANNELLPVTEEQILAVLPDDLLAKELRRRGYTLCAFRPALIEL